MNLNLKWILILEILLSFTVSCVRPHQGDNENQGKTFYVYSFKYQSEISKYYNSIWPVPLEKVYDFEVCLKEAKSEKALLGQMDFQIENLQSKKTRDLTTNEQGCLKWQENLEYDFFEKPQYLPYHHELRAKSLHKGQEWLELRVNPWLSKSENKEVVALKFTPAFNSLFKTENAFSLPSENLQIDNLQAHIKENKLGEMSVEIQFKPFLILKDWQNQNFNFSLNKGQFKVEALFYLETSEGQKEYLSPLLKTLSTNDNENLFTAEMFFNLSAMPTNGLIRLALRLSPVEPFPKGLSSFQGVYRWKEAPHFKGSGSLILSKDEFPSFKAELFKEMTSSDEKNKYEWQVDQLIFSSLGIKEGESASNRTLFIGVKACIKNPMENEKIPKTKIKIKTLSGIEKEQDSDTFGCIKWVDEYYHEYYSDKKGEVRSLVLESDKFKHKIDVFLNPWDKSNIATDMRYLADFNFKSEIELPAPAQILIKSIGFDALKTDYIIDSMLNLKLKKKFMIRVEPRVTKSKNLSLGRFANEPLRDGIYLLKFALLRNDFENEDTVGDLISYQEKLVNVSDGTIIENIDVVISDIRLMDSRNILLLEILPVFEDKIDNTKPLLSLKTPSESFEPIIDRKSKLITKTFLAPFIPLHDGSSHSMKNFNYFEEVKRKICEKDFADLEICPSTLTIKKIVESQKNKVKKSPFQKEREFSLFLKKHYLNLDKKEMAPFNMKKNPEEFLSLFKDERVPRSDLKDWLTLINDHKMSSSLQQTLCSYYIGLLKPHFLPQNNSLLNHDLKMALDRWFVSCLEEAENPQNSLFSTISQMNIHEIGSFKYLEGETLNYQVNTYFSLTESYSDSYTVSDSFYIALKVDPLKEGMQFAKSTEEGLSLKDPLQEILQAQSLSPFLNFISPSVGYSHTWSYSNSITNAKNQGLNINTGTYLAVQKSDFNIEVKDYEPCVEIRLSPSFLKKIGILSYQKHIIGKKEDYIKTINRGFYLCSGERAHKAKTIQESYYYFAQHFTGGHLQDSTDLRNRPFLISMRGLRDFSVFSGIVQNIPHLIKNQSSSEKAYVPLAMLFTALKNFAPSFPGTYAEVPNEMNDLMETFQKNLKENEDKSKLGD